jgi:MerR family transcriptional regulator/heat shock protein HspR
MERHDTRAVYVISVAAELAGVHPQTLRIYERKGLIAPARTSGRSRRYSDHDISMLRRIQDLTTAGVSLAGVERILDLETELEDARARLREVEAALVDALRDARDMVEAAHASHRYEVVPFTPSTIERFEQQPAKYPEQTKYPRSVT